jgi:peptidoglycan/xylan/chitin deacetylase (PgdA/CDA1 family)/cell division protein FtsB
MENNEYTYARRGERQRRRRKARRKKSPFRFIFIILIVIIISVAGAGSYLAFTEQQQQKVKADFFAKSEQNLLEQIKEQQMAEGPESKETITQHGNLETMLFLPVDQAVPEQPSEIQKQLQALVQQEEQKHSQDTPIKLVARIKKSLIAKAIVKFQPAIDTYIWNESSQEWTVQTNNGDQSLLVNEATHQPLTLKDIFVNEANFDAVEQVIHQKLLQNHSDDPNAIDKVFSLPKMKFSETNFVYDPDKITLSLPENQFNDKNVTLAFKDIIGYLNPEYIDPNVVQEATPPPLDPNKKYVALTFDDGPNPDTTPQLLDTLKEKEVKVTFFMLGQNVEHNQELVKRVKNEGHEVASHSYSHPQLTGCSPETVKAEIQKTDKAIYQAIGELPLDFRPPYGSVNAETAAIIGKPIIQWSVDSEDWKSRNAQTIVQKVQATAYNDSIILLHDIHPETVAAVPELIDRLRADGFEIIPVQQLLGKQAKPMHMYYGAKDERPVQ